MENSPPKNPPPIHQLPNELLVKIIEKCPRTEWPSLELVDHKFQDAVLLAWGSVREVDLERDFIYSTPKANEDDNNRAGDNMARDRLRRQIDGKTESILKKLIDYSPRITSLSGLSLIADDPTVNSTAVQYLSRFEHLKTIKFAKKYFSGQIVNRFHQTDAHIFWSSLPSISFVEFIETTQSRATMKEIIIEECIIPYDPIIVASFDQRLRDAFANNPNDPTRPLLQLESFSMVKITGANYPFEFFDSIDASNMTKLSLGDSHVEPAALTTLINGAPYLQHLDFGFLRPCEVYDATNGCLGGRLQSNKQLLAELGSREQLTSLGINSIWTQPRCACDGFETEFMNMFRTVAQRLVKLVFKPHILPDDVRMGDIRDIIQHDMSQLKSITLNEWCTENPERLRGIADGKELEEIEITLWRIADYNMVILDEVMSTIISNSPHLKRFNVNYRPDQRAVAELCKLSDLIDLQIGADRLTRKNFAAFSQQAFADKLEILYLGNIRRGGESGLIKLIEKASKLRQLVVTGNVTDRLLECLAMSCPNLEKFWTRSVDGITIDGVQTLVDQCPKLRSLGVINTDGSLESTLKKNLKLEQYRKLEFDF